MKKNIILIVFLILKIGMFAENAEKSNKKEYTAVVLRDFPPLYIVNEKGEHDGFAIDILKNVSKISGFTVKYKQAENWEEAIKMIREGKADFIPAAGINSDRKDEFIFSKEVETIPVSCFVRSKNIDIKEIESLVGKKTGMLKGAAAEKELKNRVPNINIISFENIETGLVYLLSGEIDAFVFPEPAF